MSDYLATDPAHDTKTVPPLLVAAAAWVLPGLGYVLIGQKWRGMVCGVTILTLIILGLLIGGIRVIEFPGFDQKGAPVLVPTQSGPNPARAWLLTASPARAVAEHPWIVPQMFNGPITFLLGQSALSLTRSGSAPKMHGRLDDIGTLYVAVAGVLNLIILIDAAHRATKQQTPHAS